MAFQGDSIYWVEVSKIVPNPFQPRREFDQRTLQELAESIRMYGVLQPLTVTRKEIQNEDGTFYTKYELIAGERRLRASKLAGVSQVPVIIRSGEQSEQEKLEIAIIENLQREDLNAVDRALAFKQLATQFKLSHAQVAKKVGRSREYVSNSIRLLGLPEFILDALQRGEIMEGHARTLLMINDKPEEQNVIFREIVLKKMSVREVEKIVRKMAKDKVRKPRKGDFDEHLLEFEKKFTETLGTRVQIQKTPFGGKLTIDYFSDDDLNKLLLLIKEEGEQKILTKREEVEKNVTQHTPLVFSEDLKEKKGDVLNEEVAHNNANIDDKILNIQHNNVNTPLGNEDNQYKKNDNLEPNVVSSDVSTTDVGSGMNSHSQITKATYFSQQGEHTTDNHLQVDNLKHTLKQQHPTAIDNNDVANSVYNNDNNLADNHHKNDYKIAQRQQLEQQNRNESESVSDSDSDSIQDSYNAPHSASKNVVTPDDELNNDDRVKDIYFTQNITHKEVNNLENNINLKAVNNEKEQEQYPAQIVDLYTKKTDHQNHNSDSDNLSGHLNGDNRNQGVNQEENNTATTNGYSLEQNTTNMVKNLSKIDDSGNTASQDNLQNDYKQQALEHRMDHGHNMNNQYKENKETEIDNNVFNNNHKNKIDLTKNVNNNGKLSDSDSLQVNENNNISNKKEQPTAKNINNNDDIYSIYNFDL